MNAFLVRPHSIFHLPFNRHTDVNDMFNAILLAVDDRFNTDDYLHGLAKAASLVNLKICSDLYALVVLQYD